MTMLNEVYANKLVVKIHDHWEGDAERPVDNLFLANASDSLFHLFDSRFDSDADSYVLEGTDSLVESMIKAIVKKNGVQTKISIKDVPSWHNVRDNTHTLLTKLSESDKVYNNLTNYFDDVICYSADGLVRGTHNLTELLDEVNNQNQIIIDGLVDRIDQRTSLSFMTDSLTTVYDSGLLGYLAPDEAWASDEDTPSHLVGKRYIGYSNWLIRASILSDSMVKKIKQDYKNILIFGAGKLLATEQLKLTKLQQYFAACGRLDTTIILID